MSKSRDIQEKPEHISSCTILWETTEDILNVKTRILPKLIEVTHYNGDNLLGGRIWPLPEQKKKELFDILYKCLEEWDCDDYTVSPSDGKHWQFKICTKGKCLRIVSGSIEPPPHGQEIKDILVEIIGDENCYFFLIPCT